MAVVAMQLAKKKEGAILPLQPVADHIDDVALDPPVIHPRHPRGQGKERRDPHRLAPAQPEQITHHSLLNGGVNHISNEMMRP